MKKLTKILCTVMAGIMVVSATPILTASAVNVAKPKINVENTNDGIKITWKKINKAKKYVIMRKAATDKKFVKIKALKRKTEFTDITVKAGETYKYRVKAKNGNDVNTSKVKKITHLKAPLIEDVSGYEGVTLKWEPVEGAKKYEIYRAVITESDLGRYKTKFEFVDTYTYDEEEYYTVEEENIFAEYKVRAVIGDTKGAFSNVVRVNYIAPPDFSAWLNEDKTAVDVIFDPIEGATAYKIYRMPQGGEYTLIAEIPAADLENYKTDSIWGQYDYVDNTLPNDGKTYYYAMEAYAPRFSVKAPQQAW